MASTSLRRGDGIGDIQIPWPSTDFDNYPFIQENGWEVGELNCNLLEPTIVGTQDNDVIIGTPDADIIHGLGGNDRIEGRGGNDIICGGDGDDTVLGDTGFRAVGGNDKIILGKGIDTAFGDGGDDIIFGNDDSNFLFGGFGNDNLCQL